MRIEPLRRDLEKRGLPSREKVKESCYKEFLETGFTPQMRLFGDVTGRQLSPVPKSQRTRKFFDAEYDPVAHIGALRDEQQELISEWFFGGKPYIEFNKHELNRIKYFGFRSKKTLAEIAQMIGEGVTERHIAFVLAGGAEQSRDLLAAEAMYGIGLQRGDKDLLNCAKDFVFKVCCTVRKGIDMLLGDTVSKVPNSKKTAKGKLSKPRLVVDTMKLPNGGEVFVKPIERPSTARKKFPRIKPKKPSRKPSNRK